ncbi:MAG: PIG-L family deacetylase [Spirochaetales bacterium]
MTIVALGAHPDDLELSMLGTLIKYREQGHAVYPVVFTDGRRTGTPPAEHVELRRAETLAAFALVGLEPTLLGFPNGATLYDSEVFRSIDDLFAKWHPEVILTHALDDYHPEHRLLGRVVTDAAWAPVFFADTMGGIDFQPDAYVDISAQFELKRQALLQHRSQNAENLVRIAEIQNRFRGLQCDFKGKVAYAEGFRLFRRIGSMRAYQLLPQ